MLQKSIVTFVDAQAGRVAPQPFSLVKESNFHRLHRDGVASMKRMTKTTMKTIICTVLRRFEFIVIASPISYDILFP